jgi:uncharacterized membrane protein
VASMLEDRMRMDCRGGEKTRCGCLWRMRQEFINGTQAPLAGIDPEGLRQAAIRVIEQQCGGSNKAMSRLESYPSSGAGGGGGGDDGVGFHVPCLYVVFGLLLIAYFWDKRA